MLTQKYRPKTFSKVEGSPFSLRVLRAVAKNPDQAPKTLLLSGPRGSGKTSCARILPRAINCEKNVEDACNRCPTCSELLGESSGLYVEYNCAHMGSVKQIRELQDSFSYSYSVGWRVVCFDEIQTSSPEAQQALLDILDETPSGLFFVLCTTDSHKILDTVKSRCLELFFEALPHEKIVQVLQSVTVEEGREFNHEVYDRIARRCDGDVRSALHYLEEALLVGEEEFLQHIILLDDLFWEIFQLAIDSNTDPELYKKKLALVLENPVQYIRRDFERFVKDLSDRVFLYREAGTGRFQSFIFEWLKIQKYLETRSDWNVYFNSLRRYRGALPPQEEEIAP